MRAKRSLHERVLDVLKNLQILGKPDSRFADPAIWGPGWGRGAIHGHRRRLISPRLRLRRRTSRVLPAPPSARCGSRFETCGALAFAQFHRPYQGFEPAQFTERWTTGGPRCTARFPQAIVRLSELAVMKVSADSNPRPRPWQAWANSSCG